MKARICLTDFISNLRAVYYLQAGRFSFFNLNRSKQL